MYRASFQRRDLRILLVRAPDVNELTRMREFVPLLFFFSFLFLLMKFLLHIAKTGLGSGHGTLKLALYPGPPPLQLIREPEYETN